MKKAMCLKMFKGIFISFLIVLLTFSVTTSETIIWDENWESSSIPSGSMPVYFNGSVDCTWDDVNCKTNPSGGSWVIWCSGYGPDCNSFCSDYKNNMEAVIYKTSSIDVSCYTGLSFSFKLWFDIGGNDNIQYWMSSDGSNWLKIMEWDGNSANNGAGWFTSNNGFTASNTFKWKFVFSSNWTGSSTEGVYIDDIKLTGTKTTPPSINYSAWSGCSNCSKSRSVTTYSWANNANCYTSNTTTETQACSTSPSPSSWSSCSGNTQTRSVYTCSGNGTWSTTTETQCCGTLPPPDYGSWSTCNNCSQSRSVTTYSWTSSPTCVTSNTTTETQACSTPPSPTSWSSCSGNTQIRSVYTCSGNGTWSTTTETQCCGTLPSTVYGPWSSCIAFLLSRDVTTYSWVAAPTCVTSSTTKETISCNAPQATPTSINATCGICDGSVSANASGGTPPYTYLWSNNCTSASCSNLCEGTYSVTVTGNDGASSTASVSVGCTIGIVDIDFINNFSIYPNPNTGKFVIEMNITKVTDLEIKLLNVIGQIIYQEKLNKYIGEYQKSLNVSDYAKGAYNLQLISDQGIINKTIIIE